MVSSGLGIEQQLLVGALELSTAHLQLHNTLPCRGFRHSSVSAPREHAHRKNQIAANRTAFRSDGLESLSPLLRVPQPARSIRGRHSSMPACSRETWSERVRGGRRRAHALVCMPARAAQDATHADTLCVPVFPAPPACLAKSVHPCRSAFSASRSPAHRLRHARQTPERRTWARDGELVAEVPPVSPKARTLAGRQQGRAAGARQHLGRRPAQSAARAFAR